MFLKVGENEIYYEIYGKGIPIIAIHGHGVDHNLMKYFIEKIVPKDNYMRIYFDLPGMGKTKVNNPIKNADEMYDTVKSFLGNIIGDEKYIIIGESYGGYLMRKFIKYEPNKILGAMFVCPVIIPEKNRRTIPQREIIDLFNNHLSRPIIVYNTTN